MGKRLEGKVAVVTGSGRGIGKGIAVTMADEGASIVVNDLGGKLDGTGKSPIADEVVAEIEKKGGKAAPNYDSVATREGAENIIQTAVDSFGRIDILVNNAGILRDRMLWNMTDEEWDAVLQTHLYGHFYCARAAATQMRSAIKEGKQQGGRIINFTSHAGIIGNAGQPNYGAAKMGVVGFTYSCALALWRYGITCNAVAPRAVTRLTDTIPDDKLRQIAASRGVDDAAALPSEDLKKIFLGDTPETVAPLVCWLASDESKHVNGHVFVASGERVGVFSFMEEAKLAFKDGAFTVDEVFRVMPLVTAGLPNRAAL